MRQRSGCKACRERHIKCVKIRDTEKCKYCIERKRCCIRGNAFRFRPVTSVKFNAGEDVGSAEQSLEFRSSQTWVRVPRSLRFMTPNKGGDEEEEEEDLERNLNNPVAEAHTRSIIEPSNPVDATNFETDQTHIFTFPDRTSLSAGSHDPAEAFAAPAVLGPPAHATPFLPPIQDVLSNAISPVQSDNNKISPPQEINISPFGSSSAFSPNGSLALRWPVDNQYEAGLLHHFIVYCTPWIDICDSRCHFGKDVPKRAAHFPVIKNGVMGLGARHLWLMGRVEKDHSQFYIDRCLQALIVALEDPLAHWDENFLVAVILLRLHEEMGDTDELCHHLGTARILNSISSFVSDGGLRESASWVSLRQHIYVSLTTQQPLNLSLEDYRHSSVFREFDDEAWANRIIFLFASVLKHVFNDSGAGSLSKERWAELDADIEEWERTKPWTFTALYTDESAGKEFNGSWPALPTAQGVVAVGLQYYHLCKILLTIYSPNTSLIGLAGARARKATDATIRKHIRLVIGYGVSNVHCGNAMFQGSHILSACGAYIIDKAEQEACIEYLKGLQIHIGWRTDKVLHDLQDQWSN
ncbi:hypothetical protein EJ04DRAFT_487423 [Polyplosphaeria fusca]|uniref:Zn(2)-C6 fungal-type domain-containing protein n=1 Tax=Polyplosphaeria fusca TaxID=682080 RepID=A0A9P4R1S6_9PLEO|nr:hypothetical protein EJ04DRAFT_487423 [Polyplosphaeria fusca]